MDEKEKNEWTDLIRDLAGLGQRNIALFLLAQIWSDYPDAETAPSAEDMLPIDSKVALAEIISEMAAPGNPLSDRLLRCMRTARTLISKGYPQMGELMVHEGYQTITKFTGDDLINHNPDSHWRAEILISALKAMPSAGSP